MAPSITMVESIGACNLELQIKDQHSLQPFLLVSLLFLSVSIFQIRFETQSYRHPRQDYHAHTALFARCLTSMARPIMLRTALVRLGRGPSATESCPQLLANLL